MARVLVVGGTGTAGRSVVAEALARGHAVTVAARHIPNPDAGWSEPGATYVQADVMAAAGLEEALDGQEVLIDTTNGQSRSGRLVLKVGTQNLLRAAELRGVDRAVLLSIVGVGGSTFPYYRAKAEQEQFYLDSALDTRVVEATQFHDLITSLFRGASRVGLLPAPNGVRFQTIATVDVARALVDAAEGVGESKSVVTVGGPETMSSRELATTYKRVTGSHAAILGIRMPGSMGRTWRSGVNLARDNPFGTVTYEEWLRERTAR